MFTKKFFLTGLTAFLALHLFFYLFLILFHQTVPVNYKDYYTSSHHYYPDSWVTQKHFNLINSLGAWDGQWYLRIADSGYPSKREVIDSYPNPYHMGGLTYAFHPFYSIVIATLNILINNAEIAAFILSNILLIANFFSIYYVVSRLYSHQIAMKTNFLLFLFPLSIFFRGYYAEGLFLLLLIWFAYFLIKRKWWYVPPLLALLCLTKPNGFYLFVPLLYVLFNDVRHKKIAIFKAILIPLFSFIPFLGWYGFNKLQMDDWNYWLKSQYVWYHPSSIFETIKENILTIFKFFSLPYHGHHASQWEVIIFFGVLFLLYKSWKKIKIELWLIVFALSVGPLLTKDFTSYSRYEIVAFPLFIYLATRLKGIPYKICLGIFFVSFLIFSLSFINWGWVE